MKLEEWLGDGKAKSLIIRRMARIHALATWPVVQETDVLELAQTITLKLLDDDDADFASEQDLLTWLNTVIKNACIDIRRRMRVRARRHPSPPDFEQIPGNQPDPLVQAIKAETSVRLREAIMHLGPRERTAVELVYFDGLRNKDAAVQLGMTEGAFDTMLSRARARLAVLLGT